MSLIYTWIYNIFLYVLPYVVLCFYGLPKVYRCVWQYCYLITYVNMFQWLACLPQPTCIVNSHVN